MRLPKLPSVTRLLTENIGSGLPNGQIDTDEESYRRLTQTTRDLNPVQQDRMIRLAWYVYDRNPIARRIIDIQTEFVLGEGISVTSEDPAVDAVMQRHWNHPINAWSRKAFVRFRDLRLFGEACWSVAETPGTGTITLNVIDPEMIARVETDGVQVDEPTVVVVKQDATVNRERRFKVIRYDAQADGFDAAATGFDGLCFYFAINKVATARRGRSDLFGLIDYIDATDQFVWSQQERARIANAMVFDVSIKGGQQVDVDAELARIRKNPPRPGTANVHSDSIIWQILSPELGATEAETMTKLLMRIVLGGAGLPEHYFAKGDETNRATAQEQSDPVIKRMTFIQRDFVAMIDMVLRYQYDRALAKDPSLPKLSLEEPVPWRIEHPDMSVKDVAKVASSVGSAVSALGEMERQEYISKDSARRAALSFVKLLGVDTDPQEEADAIAKQPKLQTIDYTRMPPDQIARALQSGAKPFPSRPTPQTATEGDYAGAIVAFWLRPQDASALAVDTGLRPQELHLTLAYLGDAAELMPRRDALLAALRDFAAAASPIYGSVSGDGAFNGDDASGLDAFYASFDSPQLPAFREALVAALAAAGFAVDLTHGFTPHITLAYLDGSMPRPRRDVVSFSMLFDALTVAIAGDRYAIPLGPKPTTESRPQVVVNVTVPEREVHVHSGDTNVSVPEREVTVNAGDVSVQPAKVDVSAPITVQPAGVTINEAAEPTRIERTVVEYDERGRPVKSIEERK